MGLTRHFLNVPSIYKLGTRWIGYIPTFLSYTISQCIADLSYGFYKSAVKNVKRNLAMAFPNAPDEKISAMARQLFRNYSKYLVDYGRFTRMSKTDILQRVVYFDGKENLDNASKMNRGLILLTAHLGNWELGGIFFGSYGIETNVITIPDSDVEIDRVRRWYRERFNVKTITIDESSLSTVEMINALNKKEIVAMLIDRYGKGPNSVTVDFFGKPTYFPPGPFILSRLTGAPVVVAFVVRERDGYRGIVKEPFVVTDRDEEIEMLKRVVKILEEYIIMYPDQWFNFSPI
ncbi:MAG: lysophospholipid acyltransferase family protein [Nitrospirae bacterium]|nr:lysophospholipid acyltransferase family protein [Nitrospirota bacterium]